MCWEHIVDKWFDPEWQEKHNTGQEQRLLMTGSAHHQDSLMGWAMACKGKATSGVTYNLDDPLSAYSNPSIHGRLQAYTEMGTQAHGPDWDLRTHTLDGEVIMRVGGGKKHEWYYIGDGLLDTANTPTLS